jgi:XTP/dITP diphosphohydrolase
MSTKKEQAEAFTRLLLIMDELREKCPWDKKQTIESLRHLTIEEMYELSDAIVEKDMDNIRKELGDVLLHIVFYSRIASESGAFEIKNVIEGICNKLIERHPHIYGDVKVDSEEEVKQNWEKIKLKEGNRTVLSGVPKGLPALIKAQRIQDKASGVGFDWENKDQVWQKVQEELGELQREINNDEREIAKIENEFGDVLFALINYGRFLRINPEDALEKTNQKFTQRFNYIEKKLKEIGKSFESSDLREMETFWEEAKRLK